jgi:peptidoglycan/xylan/chitin deacetylase (PgdA/CDA1 family)
MRSRLDAPLLAGALFAGGWCIPALAPIAAPVANALRVPRHLDRITLTFDDGPHPEGTPAVLDLLAAAGATATFFMVGERVLAAPDVAAEVARRGHTIGVHGQRHHNLLRLSPGAIGHDLALAGEVIGTHTGAELTLHRPPYGIYSWTALALVRKRGWSPLLWSCWGHDWRHTATARSIADEVTRDLRAGDVILLHDGDDYSAPGSWRATVAALPRILEAVQGR